MPTYVDTIESDSLAASSTGMLPSIIGFYFAFRTFIMLLSVRVLGLTPQTGTGLSLALDYFFLLVVAFCVLGEVRYPFKKMARVQDVRWALFFLLFSGCSLLWSSTVSMTAAMAYWCAMVTDVAIVVMLFRLGPLTEAAESLMAGYVWGACVVAVIAWIMPAQSDLRLGDEELLGTNQIGYLCAFAFFFAQYLIRKNKRHFGVPAFLLAVTLLRSLSKTTIIAFLVSESFLLIRDRSLSRRSKMLAALAAAAVVAVFWGLLTSYYDVYINAGNQSETLTGRLGLWTYFLAEAVQQPWIGHGFDSVWKAVPPFGPDQFEAAHAHNELIQQFFAYGAMGIIMFLGIYGSLYRHIRKLSVGPFRTFLLAFLLFVLIRGLADTERFDLSLPMWAIVMFGLLIEQARNSTLKLPARMEESHVANVLKNFAIVDRKWLE